MTGERNLLVCAGLDPSGGAGILADTRVAAAFGVRPVGVVTALTVQDTSGVRASQNVDAELVRDQLEALLSDVEVHAVKIGMVGSVAIARAIGKALDLTQTAVVWDPVMDPSRGRSWDPSERFDDAIEALAAHVRLWTPNAHELAAIANQEVTTVEQALAAATTLVQRHGCAVLVKGGHLVLHEDRAVDLLVTAGGHERLEGPRVPRGEDVHGTGCALSTAIAAELAKGATLIDACRSAKQFVHARIERPARPGRGAPAVM